MITYLFKNHKTFLRNETRFINFSVTHKSSLRDVVRVDLVI